MLVHIPARPTFDVTAHIFGDIRIASHQASEQAHLALLEVLPKFPRRALARARGQERRDGRIARVGDVNVIGLLVREAQVAPDADGGFSWEKTDLVEQLKALA
jgi:hypothetical protein